jgi:formylmethanofuran dehydrogenase subunit E
MAVHDVPEIPAPPGHESAICDRCAVTFPNPDGALVTGDLLCEPCRAARFHEQADA